MDSEFEFEERTITFEYSEDLYKSLINSIQDLFYRTDMQGRITFISPSVKKLSGFTVTEATGMKMAEEVYAFPEERAELMTLLQKDGKVTQFEAQLKRKDGSLWWASTNAHFYKDSEGNIAGIEGITRDITKRKEAELELLNHKNELEEIVKQRCREVIQASKMASLGEMTASIAYEMKQTYTSLMQSLPYAIDSIKNGEYDEAVITLENSEKVLQQCYKVLERMQHFGHK